MRTRRCAMLRKNSSEWRFFCRGYLSGSAGPKTVMALACTSQACPLPGEGTTSPSTLMAAPVPLSPNVSRASVPASTTHCRLVRHDPSFSSRKVTPLPSRLVRIQPHTVTSFAGFVAFSMSLMSVFCMVSPPRVPLQFLALQADLCGSNTVFCSHFLRARPWQDDPPSRIAP